MLRPVATQVAILSDDRMHSDGLAQFLSEQTELPVCAYCPDPDASLADLAREYDVILIDARHHRYSSAAPAIPESAVVMFVGASENDAWATAVLSAGARGILTRTAGRDDLVKAIQVVRGGGIWARRRWLNACVTFIVGASRQQLAAESLESRLSRREREVLEHAATGIGNKELADRLSISEATVKVHLTHIFQKLGVPSRAALAAAYHDAGRTTNGVRL